MHKQDPRRGAAQFRREVEERPEREGGREPQAQGRRRRAEVPQGGFGQDGRARQREGRRGADVREPDVPHASGDPQPEDRQLRQVGRRGARQHRRTGVRRRDGAAQDDARHLLHLPGRQGRGAHGEGHQLVHAADRPPAQEKQHRRADVQHAARRLHEPHQGRHETRRREVLRTDAPAHQQRPRGGREGRSPASRELLQRREGRSARRHAPAHLDVRHHARLRRRGAQQAPQPAGRARE